MNAEEYTIDTDPRVAEYYGPPKWVRDNRTFKNWLHSTGQRERYLLFKKETKMKNQKLKEAIQ